MVRSLLFWVLISLAINALAGLVGFAIAADQLARVPMSANADGIVVLTGGSGERIRKAAKLLQAKKAPRLLVSGINPKVSRQDLIKLSGLSIIELDCCVDLDVQAKNTTGNARQIAAWSRSKNYTSLLVVTSGYHMPRAMVELQTVLPDTVLYPVAVPNTGAARQHAMRRTITEYAKYLVVLFRGLQTPIQTKESR
ncbi:YdcF-like protein [hydrothermal vent metagenome]|uniref:YdcF-like protein n=1 Tax=hydrothermal vent metagenome TaxID=652676 RepID=A0A3B0RMC6_9ZZZZ